MVNTKKSISNHEPLAIKPSPFKTIIIDTVGDHNPQQKILATIGTYNLENCVVKIIYSVKPDQADNIDIEKIQELLINTSFYSITPVIVQKPYKTNFPEIDAQLYNSPLEALNRYLCKKPTTLKPELLYKAQLLLNELTEKVN